MFEGFQRFLILTCATLLITAPICRADNTNREGLIYLGGLTCIGALTYLASHSDDYGWHPAVSPALLFTNFVLTAGLGLRPVFIILNSQDRHRQQLRRERDGPPKESDDPWQLDCPHNDP